VAVPSSASFFAQRSEHLRLIFAYNDSSPLTCQLRIGYEKPEQHQHPSTSETDQMNAADYRAARGSLAGTSFHELWALSQAMKLLDTRTAVTAVSVEGVGPASKLVQQSTDYGVLSKFESSGTPPVWMRFEYPAANRAAA
jgi:hypothetical protein